MKVNKKTYSILQEWLFKVIFQKSRAYPINEMFTESKLIDTRQLFSAKFLINTYSGNLEIVPINTKPEIRKAG